MSEKIVHLFPTTAPDKFQDQVCALLQRVMQPKGYSPDYQDFVLERVLEATAKVRKWFEGFEVALPANLTPTQRNAIELEFKAVSDRMQVDYLGAIIGEAYLRASIEKQAEDFGLNMKPINEV